MEAKSSNDGQQSRSCYDRPIIKVSVTLLKTYNVINQRYYEAKKQKQLELACVPSKEPKPTVPENGQDDKDSNYVFRPKETLHGRYVIDSAIGKGSFGRVVKAYDLQDKEFVAIKVIKSRRAYYVQAQIEVAILHALQADAKWNIVTMKDAFVHRNHQCIVFELLSLSLYDLLQTTDFAGVSLNLVEKFAKSLLATLGFLAARHGKDGKAIIHCDLKPENILLRDACSNAIKVIDFGSACFSNQRMYTYIQSRFYRAPEVVLGLNYGTAIDMWSLGCVLMEMHTGKPLFPAKNDGELIAQQVELLGVPPADMVSKGRKGSKYFQPREDGAGWVLKSRIALTTRSLRGELKEKWKPTMKYLRLIHLIGAMLDYNPSTRIRPAQARKHPFFDSNNGDDCILTEDEYVREEQQLAAARSVGSSVLADAQSSDPPSTGMLPLTTSAALTSPLQTSRGGPGAGASSSSSTPLTASSVGMASTARWTPGGGSGSSGTRASSGLETPSALSVAPAPGLAASVASISGGTSSAQGPPSDSSVAADAIGGPSVGASAGACGGLGGSGLARGSVCVQQLPSADVPATLHRRSVWSGCDRES